MARQVAPLEFNTFVGGLVTDAGPLTFPANGSITEDNMVLDINGLRRRRLGMDYENSYSEITTGITYDSAETFGHTTYRWDNAGNSPDTSLLVVQFGEEIKFFNLSNSTISSEVIDTHTFDSSVSANHFSYATIDGLLVVATGEKNITIFEYDSTGNTISSSTDYLTVRDLWGIDVEISSTKLRDGANITVRPTSINDSHKYNLRNQSWATPRRDGNNETDIDPISAFYSATSNSKYPSNADAVTKALYPDANDSDNRVIDRFFASDLVTNQYGSSHAPLGHYIIDAMERGTSRKTAYDQTISQNSGVSMLTITTLPTDTTSGGPSVIEQFSGRVFFSGFNGNLTGGDDRSPRMASYVLFSGLVDSIKDITRCYQKGDPTSADEPELVDTDGGFVRIDEAYGINQLVNLGSALFVFARNGIWYISGTDTGGNFTATGYSVVKVSDRGCINGNSVVEVEDSAVYWGEDGIYAISRNQLGDWVVQSITEGRINELYKALTAEERFNAQGQYDGFERTIHWVYKNKLNSSDEVKELIYNRNLNAFYTHTLKHPSGSLPKTVNMFTVNPYQVGESPQQVQVNGDNVQVNGDNVVVSFDKTTSLFRENYYIIITELDTVIKYTFGFYRDEDFLDYKTFDGTGTDAAGTLVTGYISGGNFINWKQGLHLTVYMAKTETGYQTNASGDYIPVNEGSVKVQTQWDWTNSANSNRWGTEWQAYRKSRLYFPVDADDTYDDGHRVVMSRGKIRGKGKVLSIKFSTEAGKDFQLYGWSMLSAIHERP